MAIPCIYHYILFAVWLEPAVTIAQRTDQSESSQDEEIKFHRNHECSTGEFPCASSSKCLAQRYWCDEIRDCPEGDDEDARYCGEKTSGFGRAFLRRIQHEDQETGCLAPEPLLPEGSLFHDHVGKGGIKCFINRFPKRCQCLVNRIRCDNLSLTAVFPFSEEITDSRAPVYSFSHNRIQFIQEDVLAMFPNLRSLDFRGNSISGINIRAFNNLSKLRRLHVGNNKLSKIDPRALWPMRNLCFLWLGQNLLQNWDPRTFNNSKLRWLDLKANRITLEPGMFENLTSLYYLELEKNEIKHVTKDRLKGLSGLLYLDVSSNLIETIDENSFEATPQLEELSLANNSLTTLPTNIFAPLHNLQFLNLSYNPGINSLPLDIFKGCGRLDRLNLSGVSINNIHREMFDDIPNNALIIFSKFHYCYYAAHIVDCFPKSDGISSSENLIELTAPRVIIWVFIALIPITNLCVLLAKWFISANDPELSDGISQRIHRHERDVMNRLRNNLFFANMLMAVYLLIIAIYDIEYRENYHREAYEWLHGFACQAAGMLASLSIFISLITICVIVVDRCICITEAQSHHLTGRGAVWVIVNVWLIGLMLFGIPVAVWDNVTGSFYGNNGLCIPLYLDEPYLNGWWYSALLFFGVFAICVGLTTFCAMKTRMFLSTRKSAEEMAEISYDVYILKRYFIILIVNLICWLPVVAIKMIAFTSFEVKNHFHSVFAILILPLVSFLTPLLHVQLFTDLRRDFIRAVSVRFNRPGNCFSQRESDAEFKDDQRCHHTVSDGNAVPNRRSHPLVARTLILKRPTLGEEAIEDDTVNLRLLHVADFRPRSHSFPRSNAC